MQKKTVVLSLILSLVMLAMVGCGEKHDEHIVRVGVCQIVDHEVFELFKEGIIEGFKNAGYEEGKNIIIDFENAQGDVTVLQSIAKKFQSGDYDILMPMGTQPTQVLTNIINEKPIIFCGVPDPVKAGVMESTNTPEGNVTGTSDIIFYKENLELLLEICPDVKNIGVLLNEGEDNSIIALEKLQELAETQNVKIVSMSVNNTNDVLSVSELLVEKVDAFMMINDNTVLAAQDSLIKIAKKYKKPLITVDESGVENGGLAVVGTSYKMVGVKAAEICVEILNGKEVKDLPVVEITDSILYVNETTAQEIGEVISNTLLERIDITYTDD